MRASPPAARTIVFKFIAVAIDIRPLHVSVGLIGRGPFHFDFFSLFHPRPRLAIVPCLDFSLSPTNDCMHSLTIDFREHKKKKRSARQASAYETACENCPAQCSNCTVTTPDRAQLCELTPEFTTSPAADGTLGSLDLEPGYWRSSSASTEIRECYHGPACVGGSAGYCDAGYEGPCKWC